MGDEKAVNKQEADFRFLTLVMSLGTAAWSQMGKVPHPGSQKIEKDLEQAQMTIEFLRMLREKTKGNLKEKESELLGNLLADLELNFADEVAKENKSGASSGAKGPDIILPQSGGNGGPEIIKPQGGGNGGPEIIKP